MTQSLKEIPATDPLSIAEQKQIIDTAILENKDRPGSVMLVLNEVQGQIGHVSPSMQAYIARQLGVPLGQVHGVVTFYSFFKTKPRGKHTIKFCLGTACYVAGVPQLIEKAKQMLNVELGETTPDGQITLEECRCVGACSQAPVVVVDEEVQGRLRPNKFPQVLKKVQKPS
ncbi:MAG TPA: NAD(P)H-dependent oxidoreductase subunit E [Anaerolineales bacterium]|nr:NAD(P)H-dependent oxidoreductase subunit E [Anaerolineales bacterium]HMZ42735.1 NAD(P)H-dependent oxidoreductase subunit E [Anaerolineales bacterium]HNA54188.1 NAD(P)H-dependent oxidoreductase subunit E [Anaerolineales bacterium]HNB85113.1 NAD(P)H-dependent oxidoreductase subunit E [Anaerolineales bacterium]HNC87498.1 NAD(P)H-dependent oxidoreductase subunit E [Anaerolineales bacterium]